MKITIKEANSKSINLYLPTIFLKSKTFLKKYISDEDFKKAKKTFRIIMKSLRSFKRKHKHFLLLEAISKDGEIVSITI